jgi:hypothetical protein
MDGLIDGVIKLNDSQEINFKFNINNVYVCVFTGLSVCVFEPIIMLNTSYHIHAKFFLVFFSLASFLTTALCKSLTELITSAISISSLLL